METCRDVLLKLVRMAMGWEKDYTLPKGIDWAEVIQLSYEQGVAAIVLDGYETYLKHNPDEKSFLGLPECRSVKIKAFSRLSSIEVGFINHLSALSGFADVMSARRIPFLVLKGFACAQYYPIPNHRGCGDIDVFTGRRYADSNNALKIEGIGVDFHYYRHSVSKIQGVAIENHRVLCDLRGPRKQTRKFEKQLEELANGCLGHNSDIVIADTQISGAVFPSADFNALFLPWHVSAHFEFERVTVRQLLDWALFLSKEGKNIDLMLFRSAKRDFTYGYSKFADILTQLSIRYLNMPVEDIPAPIIEDAMSIDSHLSDLVFDYMFIGKPRERDANVWKFRLNNIRRIWRERWKYRQLYQMSVFSFMIHKISGVLFGVGEEG